MIKGYGRRMCIVVKFINIEASRVRFLPPSPPKRFCSPPPPIFLQNDIKIHEILVYKTNTHQLLL